MKIVFVEQKHDIDILKKHLQKLFFFENDFFEQIDSQCCIIKKR